MHYQTEIFPLVKSPYWKSCVTLIFRNPLQQMAVVLDLYFNLCAAAALYRHPKWMRLQEELYLQGHHLMELGRGLLLSSLSSDPFTELTSN